MHLRRGSTCEGGLKRSGDALRRHAGWQLYRGDSMQLLLGHLRLRLPRECGNPCFHHWNSGDDAGFSRGQWSRDTGPGMDLLWSGVDMFFVMRPQVITLSRVNQMSNSVSEFVFSTKLKILRRGGKSKAKQELPWVTWPVTPTITKEQKFLEGKAMGLELSIV